MMEQASLLIPLPRLMMIFMEKPSGVFQGDVMEVAATAGMMLMDDPVVFRAV